MPDWTTITDQQIDQDSPVTQPVMFALRDNVEAVATAADGAPRIVPRALKTNLAGTFGNALEFDATGVESVRVQFSGAKVSTGSSQFRFRLSSDGGSSYFASQDLVEIFINSGDGSETFQGYTEINLVTGAWSVTGLRISENSPTEIETVGTSGTITISATVNYFRLERNGDNDARFAGICTIEGGVD